MFAPWIGAAAAGTCIGGTVDDMDLVPGVKLAVRRTPVCAWPGVVGDDAFVPIASPPAVDLQQLGWVAASRTGVRVVAVLDTAVEAPGWELLVVSSTDEGATWKLEARLRKPYYAAVVSDIAVDEQGHLSLTVMLDDDYGSGTRAGRYGAVSRDGGRTFTDLAYRGPR